MNMRAILNDYVDRNGARFRCGCLVRKHAYITIEFNDSKPGRKRGWRIRCLRHHRLRCAEYMRQRRGAVSR